MLYVFRQELWAVSWIYPRNLAKVFLVLEFSMSFELVKKQLFLCEIAFLSLGPKSLLDTRND